MIESEKQEPPPYPTHNNRVKSIAQYCITTPSIRYNYTRFQNSTYVGTYSRYHYLEEFRYLKILHHHIVGRHTQGAHDEPVDPFTSKGVGAGDAQRKNRKAIAEGSRVAPKK